METSDWKEKEYLLPETLKLKSIRRREETLHKKYWCKKKKTKKKKKNQ